MTEDVYCAFCEAGYTLENGWHPYFDSRSVKRRMYCRRHTAAKSAEKALRAFHLPDDKHAEALAARCVSLSNTHAHLLTRCVLCGWPGTLDKMDVPEKGVGVRGYVNDFLTDGFGRTVPPNSTLCILCYQMVDVLLNREYWLREQRRTFQLRNLVRRQERGNDA